MTAPVEIDARIVELARQPTLAVRMQQPMSELDLSVLFDRYMPAVGAKVQETGASMAGAPFGRYHRFGPDIVDVEIGFPVAAWPAGVPALEDCAPGEIGTSELPGGAAALLVHRGSVRHAEQGVRRAPRLDPRPGSGRRDPVRGSRTSTTRAPSRTEPRSGRRSTGRSADGPPASRALPSGAQAGAPGRAG